jgi:hypothetical protein
MIVRIELHENEQGQEIHEMFEIRMIDLKEHLIHGKNDSTQQHEL